MTFKFCDAFPHHPQLKNYTPIKHVNVLVMGSSTECPTTLTSCLITCRMKCIPRVNLSILMPPMTVTPMPSMLLKKEKKPNR